jgi:hypothetical protein
LCASAESGTPDPRWSQTINRLKYGLAVVKATLTSPVDGHPGAANAAKQGQLNYRVGAVDCL